MHRKETNSRRHDKLQDVPAAFLDNQSGDLKVVDLLTISEAAAFLSISLRSTRRLQQSRQIPFTKIGGSVRILRGDLIAYVMQRRVKSLDQ